MPLICQVKIDTNNQILPHTLDLLILRVKISIISINFLQKGHVPINIPVISVIGSQMWTFVWFNLMCDADKACHVVICVTWDVQVVLVQNEQGLKA